MDNIKLKIKRIENRMTQKEVAERLGISIPAYSFLESGKRKGRLELWIQIQNLFHISDAEMWQIVKHNGEEDL